MRVALNFNNKEIHRLANTWFQSFIHEQPDRFESVKADIDDVRDIDPEGSGLLAWIEGESYLPAKIYAEWWQKKLGAKTYILWDQSDEYLGWVVWLPMGINKFKGVRG